MAFYIRPQEYRGFMNLAQKAVEAGNQRSVDAAKAVQPGKLLDSFMEKQRQNELMQMKRDEVQKVNATNEALKGLLPEGVDVGQGDVGQYLTTDINLKKLKAQTPGTPEYEALKKAALDEYESKRKLDKKYSTAKGPKPVFMIDPKTGRGNWVTPGQDTKGMVPSDVYKSLLSQNKKGSDNASTEIAKLIGTSGNNEAIQNLYSRYKKLPGATPKEFLNKLYEAGGVNMEDKGWLDFGNKDLDLDRLAAQIREAEKLLQKKPDSKSISSKDVTPIPTTTVTNRRDARDKLLGN